MINFYPVWITSAGALPSVTEGNAVNIALSAIREAVFMGISGLSSIDIGEPASSVNSLKINGFSKSFSVSGNTIVLANAMASSDVIDITTSDTITYTLLHDDLPPGLSLSSDGNISGTVSSLATNNASVIYNFAIRATDGTSVRDQQFNINALTVSAQLSPPGWGSLPTPHGLVTAYGSFLYTPLGDAIRGNPFEFQLPLFEPAGTLPPTLNLDYFLASNTITTPFNYLPNNLTLGVNSGRISGTIDPSVELGQYFFTITMEDSRGNPITVGTGATPINFMIEVTAPLQPLVPLRFIVWDTPAGSLGTIYEGQAFPTNVVASCTTGEAINYSIVHNTSLPAGLTLDPNTGYIVGIVGHVTVDTTYTFDVRAMVGQTFAIQTFSITVKGRYTTASFVNLNFLLRLMDTAPMAQFYTNTITSSQYFRPTDSNFQSIQAQNNMLTMFIVGGLAGTPYDFEGIVRASNYQAPVTLRLGEHKIAYARINNSVVYEVLYREIIDPLQGSGGYDLVNGIPVIDQVIYPESPTGSPEYLYPSSIDNIRYEFINALGFPTVDPTLAYNVDLSNQSENLPFWMTCPQSGTDVTTALGYIPAVVIAYLNPGQGAIVINNINNQPIYTIGDEPNPVGIGYPLTFDQYFVVFQTISPETTFDDDTTTFDNGRTFFDTFATAGNQLIRMNRSNYS